MEAPARVLVVASHPIHYFAPLYAEYAKDPRISFQVAFCSMQGAEALRDPGFGVDVAWDVPLLEGYEWSHPRDRSPVPGGGRFLGRVNPGLWPEITRGRFDVVVIHGYRTASYLIAAAAARRGGAGLALFSDTVSLRGISSSSWRMRAKRVALPGVFRGVDAFFAMSSAAMRFLRARGVPDRKLFLTPYVVDPTAFSAAAGEGGGAEVRSELGVPAAAPLALYCGKLVPWKRPGDVIEAARAVPELHVLFAGDGTLRLELQARVAELGLADRIHFLGFVNRTRLPHVYAAADLLVLPSSVEAFGLVVNEAFGAGIPAVVSDACGAVGDLVRPGDTGLVFPVGDVPALADDVRRLARGPDERRAMGRRAKARIQEWGPSQNVEAFVAACLDLAAGPAGRTDGERGSG